MSMQQNNKQSLPTTNKTIFFVPIISDSDQPVAFSQNEPPLLFLSLASLALLVAACTFYTQYSLICTCYNPFEPVPDPDTLELVELRFLLHDPHPIPRDIM